MNDMLSAIRSRRSGGGLMDQEGAPRPEQQQSQGEGLKGLVSSLDETQKAELLQLLVKDQAANEKAPALEKGAMGPGEESELEEYVSEMEPEEGHETEDQIAESMVSSADRSRAAEGTKPRNLGERVKIDLAKKMKK